MKVEMSSLSPSATVYHFSSPHLGFCQMYLNNMDDVSDGFKVISSSDSYYSLNFSVCSSGSPLSAKGVFFFFRLHLMSSLALSQGIPRLSGATCCCQGLFIQGWPRYCTPQY